MESKRTLKKGLLIFAGTVHDGTEVFEVLEPDVPSRLALYRCDNKFHALDDVQSLFDNDHHRREEDVPVVHVMHVTGDFGHLYEYRGPLAPMRRLREWNGNLVKRHRKGGFSQQRFARIAEESRHGYVGRVATDMMAFAKPVVTLLFGSREMCDMLQEDLNVERHGRVVYVDQRDIPVPKALDDVVRRSLAEISRTANDRFLSEVKDALSMNSDRLLFGWDEVRRYGYDQLKFVLLATTTTTTGDCACDSEKIIKVEPHDMPVHGVDAIGVMHAGLRCMNDYDDE